MGDCGRSAFSDFGLELFDVLIGKLDGADEGLAFAHAVAIRAAGHEQIEAVRKFKIMLGNGSGMFGVKTFDAIESGLNHARDDFIAMASARDGP